MSNSDKIPDSALLVVNGQLPDLGQLRDWAARCTYRIAVDGGAHHFWQAGVQPDWLLGDFDSFPLDMPAEWLTTCQQRIFPADKDATDFELALRLAMELGCRQLIILAALGGRWDQTFANVLLMTQPYLADCDVQMLAGDQLLRVLFAGRVYRFDGAAYSVFSVLPLAGPVAGLTIQGARWDLQGADLPFWSSQGVSNQFLRQTVEISFASGCLLYCYQTPVV